VLVAAVVVVVVDVGLVVVVVVVGLVGAPSADVDPSGSPIPFTGPTGEQPSQSVIQSAGVTSLRIDRTSIS
jgi:hypothetical protein